MTELVPFTAPETRPAEFCQAPALILASGTQAETRFLEFFTLTIRNRNTHAAYARAAAEFCVFVQGRGVTRLAEIQPIHVAAYIEALTSSPAPATAKQRLAAVRMLCDWLVLPV
jgi:integrase/recombinase XerC